MSSLERIRMADGEPIAVMHNDLSSGLVQLTVEQLEQHGLLVTHAFTMGEP